MGDSYVIQAAGDFLAQLSRWSYWQETVFHLGRRHAVIYFLGAMPLVWLVEFKAPRRWWIPFLTILSGCFIVATLSRNPVDMTWNWKASWVFPVVVLLCLVGVYRLARHAERKCARPGENPWGPLLGAVFIVVVVFCALYGLRSWLNHISDPRTHERVYGKLAYTILPDFHQVGFAYLLMKAVHYIWDCCQGRILKKDWWRFFCWMTFFPSFRVGPLERYHDFFTQIERCHRYWKPSDLWWGGWRIFQGVFKNLVAIFAAQTFLFREVAVDVVKNGHAVERTVPYEMALFFFPDQLTYGQLWALTWVMTVVLYMDFSGYCDVAIGLARLMGYRMVENFNHPFVSPSMREWWRRWHISMSMFFRDYCYIPLGGNRRRVHLNYIITFTLVGLWHELRPHYLIWGVIQGASLSWLRLWRWLWARPILRESRLYRVLLATRIAGGGVVGQVLSIVLTANFFAVTFLLFVHVGGLVVAWHLLTRPLMWLF